jgi:hypothetical protein
VRSTVTVLIENKLKKDQSETTKSKCRKGLYAAAIFAEVECIELEKAKLGLL